MCKLRPRARADLPKVSQPAGARRQLGLHAGSPRPSAPDGSGGPRLNPASKAASSTGAEGPTAGGRCRLGLAKRLGPGPGWLGPGPRWPPPPSPAHLSRTAQPTATPPVGTEGLAGLVAAGSGCARRTPARRPQELPQVGAGLAARQPRPVRSMPQTRAQQGRRWPPLGLFTPLRGWTRNGRHVTCTSRARPGVGQGRGGRGGRLRGRPRRSSSVLPASLRCGWKGRNAPRLTRPRKGKDSHYPLRSFCNPWARSHQLLVIWKEKAIRSSNKT